MRKNIIRNIFGRSSLQELQDVSVTGTRTIPPWGPGNAKNPMDSTGLRSITSSHGIIMTLTRYQEKLRLLARVSALLEMPYQNIIG